jgi:hypothetical protein
MKGKENKNNKQNSREEKVLNNPRQQQQFTEIVRRTNFLILKLGIPRGAEGKKERRRK